MSHRVNRINNLIFEEVAPIIGNIHDKYLGMITVTAVETSPDLSQSTIWLSTQKKDLTPKEILKIIKNHTQGFQAKLVKKLYLKRVPRLVYKVDNSQGNMSRINEIFNILDKGENLPLE